MDGWKCAKAVELLRDPNRILRPPNLSLGQKAHMSTESPAKGSGSIAATISNGVVHALADTIGRGPTKARAHISQDMIAVVLRDYMTKSEKTLVADGKAEIVLAGRRAIQEGMKQTLVKVVEDATGRTVEAFFSDNRTNPDMAVEVFILVPLGDGSAPSRRVFEVDGIVNHSVNGTPGVEAAASTNGRPDDA
jgi:uncharacterized protein YbcI